MIKFVVCFPLAKKEVYAIHCQNITSTAIYHLFYGLPWYSVTKLPRAPIIFCTAAPTNCSISLNNDFSSHWCALYSNIYSVAFVWYNHFLEYTSSLFKHFLLCISTSHRVLLTPFTGCNHLFRSFNIFYLHKPKKA